MGRPGKFLRILGFFLWEKGPQIEVGNICSSIYEAMEAYQNPREIQELYAQRIYECAHIQKNMKMYMRAW